MTQFVNVIAHTICITTIVSILTLLGRALAIENIIPRIISIVLGTSMYLLLRIGGISISEIVFRSATYKCFTNCKPSSYGDQNLLKELGFGTIENIEKYDFDVAKKIGTTIDGFNYIESWNILAVMCLILIGFLGSFFALRTLHSVLDSISVRITLAIATYIMFVCLEIYIFSFGFNIHPSVYTSNVALSLQLIPNLCIAIGIATEMLLLEFKG